MQATTYNAIVVSSGISGGAAVKALTEQGLRVLLLDRGKNVEHIEMGTARMGRDPKRSVLKKHNQVWDALNVFFTDGWCMGVDGVPESVPDVAKRDRA